MASGAFAPTPAPKRRIATRVWLGTAAVVVLAALAAVASSYFIGERAAALTEQDTIVLADFATPESRD